MVKKWAGVILAASLPLASHAGLINGSFEDLGGQSLTQGGGNWDYFESIPGWTGIDHLEIHNGIGVNPFALAQDGRYYAELNAHPRQSGSFELFQTFDTVANTVYSLEFYAQKRENNDGHFLVSAGDLIDQVINTHTTGGWTHYQYEFTATAATTTLGFLSGQSGGDTTGHYLDNVSVTTVSVPEPGVLTLLAGGILALGLARRRSA